MYRERKPHIGFFGKRNNGKSTLINRLTGQDVAIVSDTPGTTTDPVRKSMEIPVLGAAVIIDTAGFDDTGKLGKMRVDKTRSVIKQIDLAVLIIAANSFDNDEKQIISNFSECNIPFIAVHNKEDIEMATAATREKYMHAGCAAFVVSSFNTSVDNIIEAITHAIPESAYTHPSMLGDIISSSDIILLITPIDSEAPEGRIILPQVQTIRDVLDNNGIAITLKETEVENFLQTTGVKPRIVITDSQIFPQAAAIIPADMMLTSFSILLARYKGDFEAYKRGTPAISQLKDGDRVLMLESCTHHVSCEDIGRFKLPRLLKQHTRKHLEFEYVQGFDYLPRPVIEYALVIQCGGCVVTPKQLEQRLMPAIAANIPVTNYGMALAYIHGIYKRAIKPFEK
ncbi:MAG: [FeFe] hydrogenase H-cluster maturation GTPase HydF [Cytophagaceae bacterium]|jgi:[FeFe] hydrogenase H-cluster maturation GTPase HydF|nr:[FeFe] hydrogenase H-cluster maturation GTPase HydF [Cytophagaceae bacterium]